MEAPLAENRLADNNGEKPRERLLLNPRTGRTKARLQRMATLAATSFVILAPTYCPIGHARRQRCSTGRTARIPDRRSDEHRSEL